MSDSVVADRAIAPIDADIRVYNTLSKTKETFKPIDPPRVGMYLCGPTVYAESHIGHMVGPVIFDTIKRYLTHCGYDVHWVVNITDVDDKLIAKSKQRGIPVSQIATEMTGDYMSNLRALDVATINSMPRATDHMPNIIRFIEQLIEKDFAYVVEGDVFFEVAKDASYGQLSNRSTDEGMGEGGGAAARKRSPNDFALWKAAKDDEISWQSPWGLGRPGWHIECSAMSRAILGETFDIHGGGLDLLFPHHENELAQSGCCHGAPMVKYWMHNGLMSREPSDGDATGKIGGRGERDAASTGKISRSSGDGGLAETIALHSGERIRFFLLRTHYRSTIVYGETGLAEAGKALESFYRYFDRFDEIYGPHFKDENGDVRSDVRPTFGLPLHRTRREIVQAIGGQPTTDLDGEFAALVAKFYAAMDDDFNTGAAISHLFDAVKSLNRYADASSLSAQSDADAVAPLVRGTTMLRSLASVLGLFGRPASAGGGDDDASAQLLDDAMNLLIELRKTARENKDYATGDAIRNRLQAMGVALLDKKEGTSWERT